MSVLYVQRIFDIFYKLLSLCLRVSQVSDKFLNFEILPETYFKVTSFPAICQVYSSVFKLKL